MRARLPSRVRIFAATAIFQACKVIYIVVREQAPQVLAHTSKEADGKLPARKLVNDATTTTWFYNTSPATELLDSPPDLTGHPDGLSLGDVYFDSADDHYRLWLWCLNDVGIQHWTAPRQTRHSMGTNFTNRNRGQSGHYLGWCAVEKGETSAMRR